EPSAPIWPAASNRPRIGEPPQFLTVDANAPIVRVMRAFPIAGTFTALVTPFTADGESIDMQALDALVEAQIQGGVSGLVPCGTTGEAPTLTDEEQVAVIQRVVTVAKKRVPVVAGTGSFSTKKTIHASKAAVAAGADGVMIVMPY